MSLDEGMDLPPTTPVPDLPKTAVNLEILVKRRLSLSRVWWDVHWTSTGV